jgi:hypothetical protein
MVNLHSRVDHLVVAAASLVEGVTWCRETLGIEPGPGGEHALMGTHNRVFRIATAQFPHAYFEIIAINAAASRPPRPRWFDLDDAKLRAAIERGPRLIHFVASTNDASAALSALSNLGIDRGPLIAAERATPAGLLRWKISVREDGQRLFDGALPTLIEWGDVHPCDAMPDSSVALLSLHATHPQAPALRAAYDAVGLQDVDIQDGPANLVTMLSTPKGIVRLESHGD